jgi:predicted  nucleic acid-binding Zn-ribbon protein
LLRENLKALVDCDITSVRIEKEITTTQKNLAAAQKQIEQFKKFLEENDQRLIQGQKNIDFYELQAQTLQDDETHKRDQLDNIKTQKEYKALEKEIATITFQRKDVDDLLLNSYHQMDLEKAKIAKDKELYEQKIEQLIKDIDTKQEHLKNLEQNLTQTHHERSALTEKIPVDWLSRYERMKHNVPDPIVPVLNECCSACFYAVLYQDMVKLKKAELLPCRNCYRFLYYDEEEQQDTQQASY